MSTPQDDQPTPRRIVEDDPQAARIEEAMAVDSVPDSVRTHADPSETEIVQRNGGQVEPVTNTGPETPAHNDVDPEAAADET